MALMRTMRRLVLLLVGLFLIAQLAGVVPRLAVAQAGAKVAAQAHHQPSHDHAGQNHSDCSKSQNHHPGEQHGNVADQCCALHLLTGVILPIDTAVPADRLAQSLVQESAAAIAGIAAHPLDRPPRSFLSL